MSLVTGIVLYVIIWWTMIFTMLPLGIKAPKAPQEHVQGAMPGAPSDPQLKRKAMLTTVISTVVWLIIYALVRSDLISFRDMAQGM